MAMDLWFQEDVARVLASVGEARCGGKRVWLIQDNRGRFQCRPVGERGPSWSYNKANAHRYETINDAMADCEWFLEHKYEIRLVPTVVQVT